MTTTKKLEEIGKRLARIDGVFNGVEYGNANNDDINLAASLELHPSRMHTLQSVPDEKKKWPIECICH